MPTVTNKHNLITRQSLGGGIPNFLDQRWQVILPSQGGAAADVHALPAVACVRLDAVHVVQLTHALQVEVRHAVV